MGSINSKDDGGLKLQLEVLEDHQGSINCMAISGDQSMIATGSEDKTICMWSTLTNNTECLGILKGHTEYITCVAICDTYIISGSADHTIRKWDMTTCECLVKYNEHTSRIAKVICTGEKVFSTSYDKTAKAWEFEPEDDDDDDTTTIEVRSLQTYKGHTRGVYSMILIPEMTGYTEGILITGSADNTARVWCTRTGAPIHIFRGHKGPISAMVTDGTILYTAGSTDLSIITWDIAKGVNIRTIHDTGNVSCMIIVQNLLYIGSSDGSAKCYVRQFGDITRSYKGHKHTIHAIKFFNGLLYTACGDGIIRIFDAKSGGLKHSFSQHTAAVTALELAGGRLFSVSTDRSVRVWDVSNIAEITDDPDLVIEDDPPDNKFQQKQDKNLNKIDTRLNGFIDNGPDQESVPGI